MAKNSDAQEIANALARVDKGAAKILVDLYAGKASSALAVHRHHTVFDAIPTHRGTLFTHKDPVGVAEARENVAQKELSKVCEVPGTEGFNVTIHYAVTGGNTDIVQSHYPCTGSSDKKRQR